MRKREPKVMSFGQLQLFVQFCVEGIFKVSMKSIRSNTLPYLVHSIYKNHDFLCLSFMLNQVLEGVEQFFPGPRLMLPLEELFTK